ncbi:fimbrial biogenesis outer membrane usher protein [Providencia sp. JGM181]|uniref:fimbria/pilus outer membrane usher protein n=1 Tax=unclassified Providencia TaxID=2633465 RepID=UPI001BAA4F46|nr:fimbrial biogenesis outer membrane usher protein [Providencia sp. JGM181]MBS0932476.1 fimbrial biogenesis outer membrane usher protein [Providencia sp. JGM172]MBS0996669.1 fimbrial biogenesis outer membrane usher protein [Providencia sp. JGM178]
METHHLIKNWFYSKKIKFINITFFSSVGFASISNASEMFDINAINTGIENKLSDSSLLNYLSKTEGQLPGRYQVNIYVNGNKVADELIEFIYDNEEKKLKPKITKEQLISWGVKPSMLLQKNEVSSTDKFLDIKYSIDGSDIHHDFFSNRLDISIPQIAMEMASRGYIDATEWDDGINGMFINYSARFNRSWGNPNSQQNIYVGLRNGINWGAWRLRNHSYYNDTNEKTILYSLQTFLERDLRDLKSHLIIGETASDNGIMDAFQYRGIKLMSEESMLPQSRRGFAPVVNGVANSNAVVTVRQNGQIIYQTSVPAGEFILNDLYPTSFNGDLQVMVTEANGSTRTFIQPFSNASIMQREGSLKYSIELGKYREERGIERPYFIQFSGIYGLPINLANYGNISLLGGAFISENKQVYVLGSGVSLGYLGGISLDMTYSQAQWQQYAKTTDQTYRLQYTKYIQNTATGLNLSAQYAVEPDINKALFRTISIDRISKKQRLQIALSQALGKWGSLNINGYQQKYWGQSGSDNNLTVGFSSQYQSINYSFSYSHSEQNNPHRVDKLFSFNCSMPFRWKEKAYWGVYSYNTSDNAGGISTFSLNGSAFNSNQLQYDITQQYHHKNQQFSHGIRGNYVTSYGEFGAGWDYASEYQAAHAEATGSLLFHQGGVTASRAFSNAIGLVKAQDIDNLKVNNAPLLHTNGQGYAVVPMLTRYERNKVSVDTSTLKGNDDVELSSATVVPTSGAIILVDLKAKRGGRVVLKLKKNNQLLGFGTQVNLLAQQHVVSSGIVANDGEVYLSGVPAQSIVHIKWGEAHTQQCQLPLQIDLSNQNIQFIDGVCQ